MKKIKIALGISAVLTAFNMNAQQSVAETERLSALSQKLQGTYQVQVIDGRDYFSFPLTMFDSIQVKRKEGETTYYWLKDNIRVMIPPYSAINKPGFKPLERIAYISSKEK